MCQGDAATDMTTSPNATLSQTVESTKKLAQDSEAAECSEFVKIIYKTLTHLDFQLILASHQIVHKETAIGRHPHTLPTIKPHHGSLTTYRCA